MTDKNTNVNRNVEIHNAMTVISDNAESMSINDWDIFGCWIKNKLEKKGYDVDYEGIAAFLESLGLPPMKE